MDIEQLKDEIGSLFCELQAAQASGDDQWLDDCRSALEDAQKELQKAEEEQEQLMELDMY